MSYFEHDDALRSMMRRARILKVDDSGSQQLVDLEGFANDKPKKVFRPMDHGFTSNPPANSEGIFIALGGRSDRVLYLDGGHKDYRPKDTVPGGAILYDDKGNIVYAKSGAGITVKAKAGNVFVTADGGNVYLGSPDGSGCSKVLTEAGPSANVYAKV